MEIFDANNNAPWMPDLNGCSRPNGNPNGGDWASPQKKKSRMNGNGHPKTVEWGHRNGHWSALSRVGKSFR